MTSERAGREDPSTRSARAKPRPAGLRRSPLPFRVGMIAFCIGGLALLVVLVLFASGTRDFPLWAWLLVALAPLGLLIASFRIRRTANSL